MPTTFLIGFVNLYTKDIEAGRHFYADLLGFTETFRTPIDGTPEHVELELNGFRFQTSQRKPKVAASPHLSLTE